MSFSVGLERSVRFEVQVILCVVRDSLLGWLCWLPTRALLLVVALAGWTLLMLMLMLKLRYLMACRQDR